MFKTLKNVIDSFSPYRVIDNYGTSKDCWSLTTAKKWLPYCGPAVVVGNRYTKKVILSRIQGVK